MEFKNPELSDEETETFTWPLIARKVIFFYTLLFALDGCTLSFFPSIDKYHQMKTTVNHLAPRTCAEYPRIAQDRR